VDATRRVRLFLIAPMQEPAVDAEPAYSGARSSPASIPESAHPQHGSSAAHAPRDEAPTGKGWLHEIKYDVPHARGDPMAAKSNCSPEPAWTGRIDISDHRSPALAEGKGSAYLDTALRAERDGVPVLAATGGNG